MKTDAPTNPTVRAAIEALQNGDRKTWAALFEPDAELYDDGSPRSLKEFTRDALGHERFTSIDRVEDNGLDLTGAHSTRINGAIFRRTSVFSFFQLSP
jgi:ketosteroid isomerase-like protein